MTIEKRGKSSWRIKEMVEGVTYSITIKSEKKPDKKLINTLLAEKMKNNAPVDSHAFKYYAEKYVELKKNTLSESTKGEYMLKIKRLSEDFQNMHISSIGKIEIQKEIDDLASRLAPKTVRDMNGFINAVLSTYQPGFIKYPITLPQKKKKEPYIPTNEDVKTILKEAENTQFIIAIRLSCWGLRRSEICCITSNDIDADDVIHINKAYVQNKYTKKWYVKSTKTTDSERDIVIPHDLAEDIRKAGKAYNGYPGSISNWMRHTQDKLGMEHFSLHKNRHYFCSALFELGYDEASILKMGGWSSDYVAKTVYRHSQISKDKEKQKEITKKLSEKLG